MNCYHIRKPMSLSSGCAFNVWVYFFYNFPHFYSLKTSSKWASYFLHVIFAFRAYNFSITSTHFSSPGIFSLPSLLPFPWLDRWYYVFIFVNKSEKTKTECHNHDFCYLCPPTVGPEIWQTDALNHWTFSFYFLLFIFTVF